jgi:predicted TIM-barrel fold metal-dependent hydrolase
MLNGFRVFDADAHALMTPGMWADLSSEFKLRRPRPIRVADSVDMGRWNTGWLIEGAMHPHPFGPGAEAANTPSMVLSEFGASPQERAAVVGFPVPVGSSDFSDPEARIQDLETMGIDIQVLFPTTLYARMTVDPRFEAALYRSYNRYMAQRCKTNPKRLKWAGLLPLREKTQAIESLDEMQSLGATAAVIFGTAGDRLISDAVFSPVWDEFANRKLPLCVHMGMSYPPLEQLCHSFQDANLIGKVIPAQLAFVALVGHGMLDRYPNLKVGFLEFGAEWIFYMFGKMDHYVRVNKQRMPLGTRLPAQDIEAYFKSGRIFVAAEAEDRMLAQELELLGEDQILCSSDFPHGEGRQSSIAQLLARTDITTEVKRKIVYDNSVGLFGEP